MIRSWRGMSAVAESLTHPAFSTEIRSHLQACRSRGSRFLVVGNLRSYGDEVISAGGACVQTVRCDRVLEINVEHETVTVESGVTIDALQRRLAPHGFVLPVNSGTAQVTIGGAIANDVHGKNHHVAGTFGCFVDRFELIRSDGQSL